MMIVKDDSYLHNRLELCAHQRGIDERLNSKGASAQARKLQQTSIF